MGPFCIFAEIRSNSSIKNKLKQLMSNSKISAAAFADTKPHYDLLDGLRGVAALMVIFYHVFEAFATSPIDQRFNHGYLAVDFFFILSGFVIGYAYDDKGFYQTSIVPFASDGCPWSCFGSYRVLYTRV